MNKQDDKPGYVGRHLRRRMVIYLGRLSPAASSDLPKAGGPRKRFGSVLLRMGFTYALPVTRKAVVSYTALPTLPHPSPGTAVYFCCTILGVASTGRYPASCPVKPGLSSPRPGFPGAGRDHLSYLFIFSYYTRKPRRRQLFFSCAAIAADGRRNARRLCGL